MLDVTLAKDTIHNPDEPRHFMGLSAIPGRIRLRIGDQIVAESTRALRLMEVGLQMYAPVIYLPRADITVGLVESSKETHCPLKGDCSWYSIAMEQGENIAWSYRSPFDFAARIADLIAFDASRTVLEESPA